MSEIEQVWFNAETDLPMTHVESAQAFFWALDAVGVVTIDNEALPPGMERLPDGMARMTISFSVDEAKKVTFQKRLRREWKAASITMGLSSELVFADLAADGWQEKWKAFFHPLRIGKRIVVEPTWEPAQTQPGDVKLVIDPGMAFGTGGHETTSMCMELLEMLEALVPKDAPVLDLGTGSGILAMTAYKLGYRDVEATDIDPEAVRVSLENFERNDIAEGVIPVSTKDLEELPKSYGIILANILAITLIELCPRILAKLGSEGHLILSGILQSQGDEVRREYEQAGLVVREALVRGEWISFWMQRPQTP